MMQMSEHEPSMPFPRDAFRDVPAWMPGTRPGMTAERKLNPSSKHWHKQSARFRWRRPIAHGARHGCE
jgi:hypothetical protein